MKILFVHAATEMSIGDVGRGYRAALERQGHEVTDYQFGKRLGYHRKAIPEELKGDSAQEAVSRMASETILNEALYCNADVVLVISGLLVHPIAMWALGRVGIRSAVILTESPYEDGHQNTWIHAPENFGIKPDLTVFCNDRYSAENNGWHFLPPSFDPRVHKPSEPDEEFACDVLMVGTGWPERQAFLEQVDWSGIKLRLYGIWNGINDNPSSPLYPFYYPSVVGNSRVPTMYCSAKINLNLHRTSPVALTPGPRSYELAACGAFQLSDPREDLKTLFRDSVPMFSTPEELGSMVRHYLAHPEEREFLAAKALDSVCNEDFDTRAATLIDTLERTPEPERLATELVGATQAN